MKLKFSDHEKAKEEVFLDGQLQVWSRSGLNITETLLLDAHQEWKPGERVLVLENRSTALPIALHLKSKTTNIDIHCFDHFYAEQIKTRLKKWCSNQVMTCSLAPDLPENQYDEIYLQVTQSISAEFVAEILQSAYGKLNDKGRLLVSSERLHRHTGSQIEKLFGKVTQKQGKQGSMWIIKKKTELKKLKSFESNFEFSLPSGLKIELQTRPGVFSHRRVDEGAQALAECMDINNGNSVMELGCGHGGVGLLAKQMAEKVNLILVDSHTRAIQCSQFNAEKNGLAPIKTVVSSNGIDQSLDVDVFLGNPPYFSDHAISKLFIDQAAFHLKKGGLMFIVAKSMDWNLEYAQQLFSNCSVLSRRNYKVLKATKA